MVRSFRKRKLIKKCVLEIASSIGRKIKDNYCIRRKKSNGPLWVRNWISKRENCGASETLLRELRGEDPAAYRNHLRMSSEEFDEILTAVHSELQRENTCMRCPIAAKTKLQVTLRFLATGDSFSTLEYMYRIPKSTISTFLPEVLDAINNFLATFIQIPKTTEEWNVIGEGFKNKWNFPNCYGALDGKHIQIQSPPNTGSEFYNYKGSFSTILLALVDDDYCFIFTDIGANGRCNDSAVFRKSNLTEILEKKKYGFPEVGVILADEAFPLKTYLMHPYGRTSGLTEKQRIFNYRLSRARRIVENAFGTMAARFRILQRPICLKLSTVDKVVQACCSLHNYLRKRNRNLYMPSGTEDAENFKEGTFREGSWRMADTKNVSRKIRFGTHNASQKAITKRDEYADFFCGDGAVPWQRKMAGLE